MESLKAKPMADLKLEFFSESIEFMSDYKAYQEATVGIGREVSMDAFQLKRYSKPSRKSAPFSWA